jgi:hypothetical protein
VRLHIQLEDDLVEELDRRAGHRRRGAFVAELIRRALDDARRWDDIEAALGSIADEGMSGTMTRANGSAASGAATNAGRAEPGARPWASARASRRARGAVTSLPAGPRCIRPTASSPPRAAGVGSRLVTGNPEDFPMRELDVEHWPVGV